MNEKIKTLKRISNRATKANKQARYMELSQQERAIRNVYTYIQLIVSKSLSTNDGDTNAELTEGSAENLIELLMALDLLDKSSIALYREFTMGTINALEDKKKFGKLINPKIAFAPLDLFMLLSLDISTLISLMRRCQWLS